MESTRESTIEDLEGGAILERLEYQLQEVVADCFDVNKVPDSAREISCKIKIKPDQRRSVLAITIDTGNKRGKRHPSRARPLWMDTLKQPLNPRQTRMTCLTRKENQISPSSADINLRGK